MAEERVRALITPPIHASGVYSLYAPFTVSLEMIYRTHAVRSFDELVKRGIDVYTTYYEPKNLSEKVYKEDAAKGASIVTLISADEEYIYVPNTYIESYPGMAGLRYERKLLMFDLGPLPANFQLDYLIGDLQDLVTKAVGVSEDKADLRFATLPMSSTVSHEEHIQLESSRRANIQLHKPLEVQLREQTERADALTEQNEKLLEVISAHPELFEDTAD